ncbi:SDR family oxidoreductase [Lichenihabitans sp. Uapishka_5]|uniref:glucose 1-dehydrogenase n=1 Tax=Lichenihabitans sp. Uapishka_5 TaxID=3037302 RepID=UPI0029E7FC91|nr:glucose 1-dehydrogenase [Lichenihabitans sp. Uapishka_5]MDX7951929.1 SDR family oxidoreductase [Lichenihabitans sp. Uapishka_5]
MAVDPRTRYPKPPFHTELQPFPGSSAKMNPQPDHGETTYKGSNKLESRVALVTGADSGIGRAVALAFAREGADVLLSYLDEEGDAAAAAKSIEEAGRQAILLPGDISKPAHCRSLVEAAVDRFGRLDILVNNGAFQATHTALDEISDEEWEATFATNIHAQFYLSKAAVPHMRPGSSIINTSSVNAKHPMPGLLAYSATKAAIANFTIGLAQMLVDKGIRVNAVLPGPIWTPFIVTGMEAEQVKTFGSQSPMGRPGQPAELAGAYVYLASDDASYTTGALLPVHGGMAIY